jgi:hypothetical protein
MGGFRERLRVGARGSDLLFFAGIWFLIGLSLLLNGDPDPEHRVPIELLPHWVRIAFWWGPAGYAVWAAFRQPPQVARAFAWLVVPAALRALSYSVAFLTSLLPESWEPGQLANRHIWLSALTWIIITGLVIRQAHRPEPPHREHESA